MYVETPGLEFLVSVLVPECVSTTDSINAAIGGSTGSRYWVDVSLRVYMATKVVHAPENDPILINPPQTIPHSLERNL